MEEIGLRSLWQHPISWLLALAIPVLMIAHRKIRSRSSKSSHRRRFSYTSASMVQGCFPPHADVPETIINAAILMEKAPSTDMIVQTVIQPMLQYERLSSIPSNNGTTRAPHQTIDPHKLVRRVQVHSDTERAVYDAVFENLQSSLSCDRNDLPWWEILVIDGKKSTSACVLRIHHGLADGISIVAVMEKIITYQDGTPLQSMGSTMDQGKKPASHRRNLFQRAWSMVREAIHVLTLGLTRFDDPIFFSRSNHATMVHSKKRSYVIFPSVDLDYIKALKNAAHVTVNDILMTAVSQAIHDYCLSQQCPVVASKQDIQCRSLLPVAMPRSSAELADPTTALRNQWCLVSTTLAVGCTDILERLRAIHTGTSELKATPRAYMQLLIQNTLPPLLPASVGQKTLYDVFSRHSLVFSNVPGPDRPCVFAGQVGTSVQMFYANLLPQIGILSYAGRVHGNIVLDPEVLPASELLATFYAQALIQLGERLGVDMKPPDDLIKAAAD